MFYFNLVLPLGGAQNHDMHPFRMKLFNRLYEKMKKLQISKKRRVSILSESVTQISWHSLGNDPLQTSELTYTIHGLPADYSYTWYMKRSFLSARK